MPEIKEQVQAYIDSVMSGERPANRWEKLAVKRHLKDLKRKRFDYHFDEQRAARPILFIENYCVHVRGDLDRQPLILESWQKFIVWVLFGWVDISGKRRFNTAFIEVAKKNGKSTLVAAIGLYMQAADGEGGAEVYSVATAKDQANIVFNDYARAMVLKSEHLQKIFKVFAHAVVDRETETSTFKALASDRDRLDGKNVHCVIIDEYHAHKTDGVYRIMVDGMSARSQPMAIIITTAGFDPDVPCVDEEEYAQRVLSGQATNDTYFAIIFTLDKKDRWDDRGKWPKANPNLGISKQSKAMDRDFEKALEMPAEQSKFKNKNLNIWTKNRIAWIRDSDWKRVEREIDISDYENQPCWMGVDLSKTQDTTAVALCFHEDEKLVLFTRIYLPDYQLKERSIRERFDWDAAYEKNEVILTDGRTIDYEVVEEKVLEDFKTYDVKELAYDPYNSTQFLTNLINAGIDESRLVEFPQSWRYMSPALKDYETDLINGVLRVQRSSVLAWMAGNAAVKRDDNDNIRIIKGMSYKHIDGIVAQVMAADRARRTVKTKSVYETRGVIRV